MFSQCSQVVLDGDWARLETCCLQQCRHDVTGYSLFGTLNIVVESRSKQLDFQTFSLLRAWAEKQWVLSSIPSVDTKWKVPEHLQGTAEVFNPQMPTGPCSELVTHLGVYPRPYVNPHSCRKSSEMETSIR